MIYLVWILIPSLLLVLLSKAVFPHHITFKEWSLQGVAVVVGTALSVLILYITTTGMSIDHEVWNGSVISKAPVHVSCTHEHQCGETCSTDSKGKKHCTPIYCPDHAFDVDWDVKTTVGTFTIDRVAFDRQGLREPKRFTAVQIGEPAAAEKYTRNYLLLDSDRFKASEGVMEKYKGRIPDYPSTYDYYRFNRVVNTTKDDFNYINDYLNKELITLGAQKQLNIVVVITDKSKDFYEALRESWDGARKNDVILVYGIDKEHHVNWFKADAFADGQSNMSMIKTLNSTALDRTLDADLVHEQLHVIQERFTRLPNKTFEYLNEDFTPPMWAIIMTVLINLLLNIGVTWFMVKNEMGEYAFMNDKGRRNARW
ncbi:hypothetical protein FDH97_gp046 [Erwinia phage vB_EamM_Deimos-Minion]|uniref:Putative membrane protein n=2 Tax=Agricanvirus TaxID=1984776 RepID=A0A173GDF3_9CAUD|nr:hypothetical protein FDH97_gp046 [Erwinia phage vB_EamM_Deimos-Minion]YP_009605830.1 hypothetical protein FDH99_gp046 [Erwinia phage vB_EamM_Simmy50]ANH51508.1 putative membrane protein [Erwinia phage vB_EamM_Simmy50]ANH52144.1 putative membrane protein [Erwinia phage vB_EamM_Deimos-Minion]